MKTIITTTIICLMLTVTAVADGTGISDTVTIKLDNDSKIIIYTRTKADLSDIQKYDINKMIRDLNQSIAKGDIQYIELEDRDGKKYLKDTTIIYQSGDQTARINIGNLSLEVEDAEDWDDIERKWDRDDKFKHYSYVDRSVDRTRNTFNIELGLNNWVDDFDNPPSARNEPYTVRPWGSWYVALNTTNKSWIGGPLFFEWGAGVSWYNWKMEDEFYKITKGAEAIQFDAVTNPDIDPIKSKLVANYINVTLLPMLDFSRGSRKVKAYERGPFRFSSSRRQGIRIGAGGYGGYRISSRTKFVFEEKGAKNKDRERNSMYLSNVRYGVRGQFGWKGLDVFVNYDLNEVFAQDKGPKLNAFSFGIIL